MMVIAVGLSSYNIALFHLINHAFYKALLFLGAGSVIHAVADNQDFRKYGGLRPFLPLTYSVMLIASLSLVAFPFMTGFYSKDFILESSYGQFSFFSIAVYFIATLGAMFTTLYSVKVLYVTFLSYPNGPQANYKMAHEGDIFMSLPLIILAVFSIFFGFMAKDIFIGLGSGFFTDNSLFIHPNHEIMVDTEFAVATFYKMLPLFLTVSLTVVSLIFSEYLYKLVLSFKLSRLGYNLFGFFNQRFYIEMFYNTYITDLMLKLGGQTTKVLDKGSIELIGPFGIEKGLVYLSNTLGRLEAANVANYALHILAGLVVYTTIPFVLSNLLIVMLFAVFIFNLGNTYTGENKHRTTKLQSKLVSPFVVKRCFTRTNPTKVDIRDPAIASDKYMKLDKTDIYSGEEVYNYYKGLNGTNKLTFRRFVNRGFTPSQAAILLTTPREHPGPITEAQGKDLAQRGYERDDVKLNQPLLHRIACIIIRGREVVTGTLFTELEKRFFLDYCNDKNIDLSVAKTNGGEVLYKKLYLLGDDILKNMLFNPVDPSHQQ